MAKYINKDALVAEIEGLKCTTFTNFDEGVNATVQTLLDFLDSLEVKEVDFHKELLSFYRHTNDSGSEIALAKHFFELGMRTSNPITAADRGIANEIIHALNTLCEERMISYDKEIEWVMNKVKED